MWKLLLELDKLLANFPFILRLGQLFDMLFALLICIQILSSVLMMPEFVIFLELFLPLLVNGSFLLILLGFESLLSLDLLLLCSYLPCLNVFVDDLQGSLVWFLLLLHLVCRHEVD